MRTIQLFLQSRRAGWTALLLLASGMFARFLLGRLEADSPLLNQALIGIPLLPAVIIGVSIQSPFGEVEEASGNWLLPFRWLHLGLLFVTAAVLLAVATIGTATEPTTELVRNLAGLTGIALIGNRLVGPMASWIAPLAFAVVSLMVDPLSRWAWLTNRPIESWSLWIAVGLLAAGLLAISLVPDRAASIEGS